MDSSSVINDFLKPDSRIFFSKLSMKGLKDFNEYSLIEELYKYLEFPPFRGIDDSRMYLEKLLLRIKLGKGSVHYWFIHLKSNSKIIGTLGLTGGDYSKNLKFLQNNFKSFSAIDLVKSGEVGKGLSPAYWGNGYMLEAMTAYLDFAFQHLSYKSLWSFTRSDNVPNIKLMEKLNFVKTAIAKDYYKKYDGKLYDAQILVLKNY